MSTAVYVALVVLGGFCNGLLGAGGGIVIIYAISYLASTSSIDVDRKDIFANALAVMIPLCMVSAIIYVFNGAFSEAVPWKLLIPAILGGITGALLLEKVKSKVLMIIFAAIMIYSGISMLMR